MTINNTNNDTTSPRLVEKKTNANQKEKENHDDDDDYEEEEEVFKDLECEEEEDEDDNHNFQMQETDYFKIIDQKLELEKLKKKNKQTNGNVGPYSCVNKYDNIRAKSMMTKAAAWEISPTKPSIDVVKTTASSLQFNKGNFDRYKSNDESENENNFELQEKLFTYHRYK